jgi:hypothetical protein
MVFGSWKKSNLVVASATLVLAALGNGCVAEPAADGEHVDVDLASFGVSSVVRVSDGEYNLIGLEGNAIGVVSARVDASGAALSATLHDEDGALSWTNDALGGGCDGQSAPLAVRDAASGEWTALETAAATPLDDCGDALMIATRVAEAEGIQVPLGPGQQPDAAASEPSTETQDYMLIEEPVGGGGCSGGSTWVWGSSCSYCFSKMKMIVGPSGSMSLACDPGYVWTSCGWSSC